MSKTKTFRVMVAIFLLINSSVGFSIDLNTKIQNADKTDFNSISSPFMSDKNFTISSELLNSVNPLVLKRNDGTTVPLIQGLNVFELSFLFGITKNLQLGILIPGENPYGIVGPYDEAKNYLSNILIEPKIYLSEGIAFIPLYYVPGSKLVHPELNSNPSDLNLGKSKGAYGAKFSFGFGDKKKNETLTAIQIGAIIAPEDKFREIDQTSRIQLGAGVSYPVSGTIRLLLEAYGEKTKNNTPIEALATIEYRNDNFLMRLGGGNGDFQGSGSNTSKLLANFTYYFGDEKSAGPQKIIEPIQKAPKIEEKKDLFKEDPIEEQSQPSFSRMSNPIQNLNNDLLISKISVPFEKREIPFSFPVPKKQEDFCFLNERRKDKKNKITRFPANDNDLEDLNKTESKEDRHVLNIKKAIQLMENNAFIYQKSLLNKDLDKAKKIEQELKWGLRVYNKNLNELNKIGKKDKILSFNFQVEIIEKILKGETVDLISNTFQVSASKLNVRSQDFISKDNILYQLNNQDEVIVVGETANNGFVQIKTISGEFQDYKYPMFVSKKFLTKKKALVLKENQEQKEPTETPLLVNQEVVLSKKEDLVFESEVRDPSSNIEINFSLPKKDLEQKREESLLFPIKLEFENKSLDSIEKQEVKQEVKQSSGVIEEVSSPKNKIEIINEQVIISKDNEEEKSLTKEQPLEPINPVAVKPITKEDLPEVNQIEIENKSSSNKNESRMKEQELKKIDELFLELKSKAKEDIKLEKKTNLKDPKKDEVDHSLKEKEDSKFQELIKKSNDGLQEEDPIEEQNGPSFGDI